jgi:4-diphosphocytidyl-2-C-methyl-D-erythritol kinase
MPDCQVSTAEVFQHQQLTRDRSPLKIARFLEQGTYFTDQFWASQTRNDCEKIVLMLYPAIAEAMNWLSQWSPARMTGTGASVFAVFDTRADAKQVLAKLPGNWKGVVTRGLNVSPLMKAEAEINDIIM